MRLFISLFIFSISFNASAWNYRETAKKEFTLKYNFEGQTLELKEVGDSYLDAMESAATRCLSHFKKVANYHPSEIEDKGRRIIDTCANPNTY